MTEQVQFARENLRNIGSVFPDLRNVLGEGYSQIFLFDMDGTLYQLDGVDNGFTNSSLEKAVLQNALRFIQYREGVSVEQAEALLNEGLTNPVGISQYTSERYGISRQEYFDEVWNIDPSDIVRECDTPIQVINQLGMNTTNGLILLTAAPRKWAERVMEFTGLTDKFIALCTGEQFNSKAEVFELIASEYDPSRVCSIGDQFVTDIEPATKLGMNTLLVNNPKELALLLQK